MELKTPVQSIDALRHNMMTRGIAATIIPHTDPHQSEYIAAHWQARRWFSGFSGSAGTLVVTLDDALLWTDSRYFLQAAQQLQGTGTRLVKQGMPGEPTIGHYLASSLKPGDTIGLDGLLFTRRDLTSMTGEAARRGVKVDTDFDPTATLWTDRPALPDGPVRVHDVKYAGVSAADKLAAMRDDLAKNHIDAHLFTALDEIAWILNLRSNDVKYNPVLTSYLYVTENKAILFLDENKLTPEVSQHLAQAGVETQPYGNVLQYVSSTGQPAIGIDPATTSVRVAAALGDRAQYHCSPAMMAKAVKNPTQAEGFRRATLRDGVALVGAMMEIEETLKSGSTLTEMAVADILLKHRSRQPLFADQSFDPIVGYGPHGAIVHYSATPESNATVGTDSLLLMDSGAQYLDGTTDITRTITLGTPTAQQRTDFTAVLQGNINLATAVFPRGTRGTQLDALAHEPLWKRGLNYLHGTGHGVGHYLNVHEGPQSIRTNEVDVTLRPGMTVTDEPGLYREGHHGIRCENMLMVVEGTKTEFGDFLQFETLTLFPFDRKLIEPAMLTDEQLEWLNNYHARVYCSLLPHLTPAQALWLHTATAPIAK